MPPEPTTIKAVPVQASLEKRAGEEAIAAIAYFKLAKALAFGLAAVSVLFIVHKDTTVLLNKCLHVFRISGDRQVVRDILEWSNVVDATYKQKVSATLFFYTLLFSTEGLGLFFKKRWAEYLTVIITSTGIPIELYFLFVHPGHHTIKIAALVINIVIVWYLVYHLARTARAHRAAAARAAEALPVKSEAPSPTIGQRAMEE